MLSESEIRTRVMELYEASGKTPQELSVKSGVPLTTLKNYLNGDTKSPGFQNMCSFIEALGGSVDEIIGIKELEHSVKADEKYVALLHDTLNIERRTKQILIVALAVVVIFLIGFLIFDMMHPEIGFFQYGSDIARYYYKDEAFSSVLSRRL